MDSKSGLPILGEIQPMTIKLCPEYLLMYAELLQFM